MTDCEAKRYAPTDCNSPAEFLVQYRSRSTNTVLDEHPACFAHGLAEVDRHTASGGMAQCDFIPLPTGWQPAATTTP